jgi:hypothetical protein
MQRPQTLAEVAEIARSDSSQFPMALDEFCDEFYLDHPDKSVQQQRLDPIPQPVGDPSIDAWNISAAAAGYGAPRTVFARGQAVLSAPNPPYAG